jgi:hypothetical protein
VMVKAAPVELKTTGTVEMSLGRPTSFDLPMHELPEPPRSIWSRIGCVALLVSIVNLNLTE